jgi:hypothetical protein
MQSPNAEATKGCQQVWCSSLGSLRSLYAASREWTKGLAEVGDACLMEKLPAEQLRSLLLCRFHLDEGVGEVEEKRAEWNECVWKEQLVVNVAIVLAQNYPERDGTQCRCDAA